jgi:uncharacterized protein YjaG (DUF416 family)
MKRVIANIPDEIHKAMKTVKEKSDRSLQWQIIRALKSYLSKKITLVENGKPNKKFTAVNAG